MEVQIVATGVYPNRQRTKVSDVAHYQNDGTEKIKPAKFVEAAAKRKREWHGDLRRAIGKFLDGDEKDMTRVGRLIARDINDRCDRIKTRRLKHSFIHRIIR
jgi:hypothetical protein